MNSKDIALILWFWTSGCIFPVSGELILGSTDEVVDYYTQGILSAAEARAYEDILITPVAPLIEGWERFIPLSRHIDPALFPSPDSLKKYYPFTRALQDSLYADYPEMEPYAHMISFEYRNRDRDVSGTVFFQNRINSYYGHSGARSRFRFTHQNIGSLAAGIVLEDTGFYWRERVVSTDFRNQIMLEAGNFTPPENPLVWGNTSSFSAVGDSGMTFLTPGKKAWNGVLAGLYQDNLSLYTLFHSRNRRQLFSSMIHYEKGEATFRTGLFYNDIHHSAAFFTHVKRENDCIHLAVDENGNGAVLGELQYRKEGRTGLYRLGVAGSGYREEFSSQISSYSKRLDTLNAAVVSIEKKGHIRKAHMGFGDEYEGVFSSGQHYLRARKSLTVYSPFYGRISLQREKSSIFDSCTYEDLLSLRIRGRFGEDRRFEPTVVSTHRFEDYHWEKSTVREELHFLSGRGWVKSISVFFRKQFACGVPPRFFTGGAFRYASPHGNWYSFDVGIPLNSSQSEGVVFNGKIRRSL